MKTFFNMIEEEKKRREESNILAHSLKMILAMDLQKKDNSETLNVNGESIHLEGNSKEKADQLLSMFDNIIVEDVDLEEEQGYDNPNGSEWIVAVDQWGFVTILKAPNIHYSFLDFRNAEEIGIPYEVDVNKTHAGVYKWTCNLNSSYDYEYSYHEYEFEVIKEELLWSPNK